MKTKIKVYTDEERAQAREYYNNGLSLALISRKMRVERTVLVRWLGLGDSVVPKYSLQRTDSRLLAGETKTDPIVAEDTKQPSHRKKRKGGVKLLSEWQGVMDKYSELKTAVRLGEETRILRCLSRLSKQCKRMSKQVI